MITVVLIGLDSKEFIRGCVDKRVIESAPIICRNGRYFTHVRSDEETQQAIYKERLAPYIIREF